MGAPVTKTVFKMRTTCKPSFLIIVRRVSYISPPQNQKIQVRLQLLLLNCSVLHSSVEHGRRFASAKSNRSFSKRAETSWIRWPRAIPD